MIFVLMLAAAADVSSLVGTWRGESLCTVKPSSCNDERVVYHIARGAAAGTVTIQADKIVDGKALDMGTLDCTWDGAALTCLIPKGTFRFELAADHLRGTLKQADGTLFRKIDVKKD